MAAILQMFRTLEQRLGIRAIVGLGATAAVLLGAAILGALAVDDEGAGDQRLVTSGTTTTLPDDGAAPDETTSTTAAGTEGTAAAPGTPGAAPGGRASGGGGSAGAAPGAAPRTTGTLPSSPGATRIGVSANAIKWGLHAPKTFDGAPLNLAEDPLEGVDIYLKYLNDAGGINGRKIEYHFADDRYTVDGGRAAANELINDKKVFFVSGTLGVDQVAQVAAEAKAKGVPYMAAGGSEGPFRSIGMFQIASSYDTHLQKLAIYLGREAKTAGSPFLNATTVGVTELDTPYIAPSVDAFDEALRQNGLQLVVRVKVPKYTDINNDHRYADQIQRLKASNGGKGPDIVVPAQDPLTTADQVKQCVSQQCGWKWSFSDFAHESDTALQLMGGQWNGIRGLAGGCYYMPGPNHNPYDTNKCAQMKVAHDRWVAVNGEDDWRKDGQGGAAGYQIVQFWAKALKDTGNDPTRERLVGALHAYDNYNDLVSGPITFRGSSNLSHGAVLMVPYQAGVDRYTQLSDGLVNF